MYMDYIMQKVFIDHMQNAQFRSASYALAVLSEPLLLTNMFCSIHRSFKQ